MAKKGFIELIFTHQYLTKTDEGDLNCHQWYFGTRKDLRRSRNISGNVLPPFADFCLHLALRS